MTHRKKVLLGVGVAGVVVMMGWGLWTIRPLPTTVETRTEGRRVMTVTRSRSHNWLPPSQYGFYSVGGQGCGPGGTMRSDTRCLGVFAVTDTRDTTYTPLPE